MIAETPGDGDRTRASIYRNRSLRMGGLSWLAACSLSCTLAPPGAADPIEDFYHDKRIDLIIGYTPGGLYDAFGRLIAQFMGDQIPGKPRIIPRNMPGGSGRRAVGFATKVAPQDGTTLVIASQALPLEQALGA